MSEMWEIPARCPACETPLPRAVIERFWQGFVSVPLKCLLCGAEIALTVRVEAE